MFFSVLSSSVNLHSFKEKENEVADVDAKHVEMKYKNLVRWRRMNARLSLTAWLKHENTLIGKSLARSIKVDLYKFAKVPRAWNGQRTKDYGRLRLKFSLTILVRDSTLQWASVEFSNNIRCTRIVSFNGITFYVLLKMLWLYTYATFCFEWTLYPESLVEPSETLGDSIA